MDKIVVTEADALRRSFDGFEAVAGFGFQVIVGEILGLLGPNGM